MKARSFIALADITAKEARELLDVAHLLKKETKSGHSRPLLGGKVAALLFQKPSLRTRVSFDVGMSQLGGRAIYLSPEEVGLGQRESVQDVARVLSRYIDVIVARVFDHKDAVELARYASVPVINGLSDYAHPCQGMADYLTIEEHLGRVQGVNISFVGDGNNNVTHSLMVGGALLGANVTIGTPSGFEPSRVAFEAATRIAGETGSIIKVVNSPREAVRGADILYTDVWTSMGQEAEAIRRRPAFVGFQLNTQLLEQARPETLVMHDLPAHRGEEITDEVIESPRSIVFDQAENRLHAQKAVLLFALGVKPYREPIGQSGSFV